MPGGDATTRTPAGGPDARAGSPGQRDAVGIGPVLGAAAALALLAAYLLLQPRIADRLDVPAFQTWATVFVAICVQALPFLVGGVLLSAVVSVIVPASFFTRVLPSRPAAAVPVAGIGGLALPGCECASVPIAASLMRRGVTPAAALTFLLAAPAINPVVLVSTAVAFPGRPEMVVARFGCSLAVAVVMGWLWLALGRKDLLRLPTRHVDETASRLEQVRAATVHDLLHAGGFLVLGAVVAATLNVAVPPHVVDAVADRPWLAVLALAALAVVVALCSEADAFVAASFRDLGPTAQLAFLVVGPAIDVKLAAMQAGTFGARFAARFAPATFVVAVGAAALVGWLFL